MLKNHAYLASQFVRQAIAHLKVPCLQVQIIPKKMALITANKIIKPTESANI